MEIGIIILPEYSWKKASAIWQQIEEIGFDYGWSYDHLAWRTLCDSTWFGTFPVLSAAACATTRLRIGTLVSTPNFRHPIQLARDAMALDDISDGRFILGLGAGGPGLDERLTGISPLPPRQRSDRFSEFVEILDQLLKFPRANYDGKYYRAVDTVMAPGCVQQPRIPFAVAATGPRGISVAARHSTIWVTNGSQKHFGTQCQEDALALAGKQLNLLRNQCEVIGRAPTSVISMANGSVMGDNPARSADSMVRFAAECAGLGFNAITFHYPRASGIFAGDTKLFARAAAKALPHIRDMSS
jgi:alkanesulfonate monooxygenase SsuD/methylene tetrahydromethanopterin reductase-like flavin-dependent oxidoreductase (luciferase family)